MNANLILNGLGALGVGRYGYFLLGQKSRNTLDSRLLFLTICLSGIFFFREFEWVGGGRVFNFLNLFFATLLPLALALTAEAMLKRHLPLFLKVYVATGTVIFWLANILGVFQTWPKIGIGFIAFSEILYFSLGYLFLTRKRHQVSGWENAVLDASVLTAAVTLILFLTDFSKLIPWFPLRMGALGALMFIYNFVRRSRLEDRLFSIAGEMIRIWVAGAVIGSCFFLLAPERSQLLLLQATSIGFALILVDRIHFRIKRFNHPDQEMNFVKWMAETGEQDIAAYIQSLAHSPSGHDFRVLDESKLQSYDLQLVVKYLSSEIQKLASLTQIRELIQQEDHDLTALEQMRDLMEANSLTHVALLRTQPITLLGAYMPQAGYSLTAEIEFSLIRKFGRVLEKLPR